MIRTLLKPLSFIPAILLMLMIYRFSAQPAEVSSQLSYKVSYKIVEAADYVFETQLDDWQKGEWATRIHGVTRKLAHMTEYFALAVAVSFPLYVYGVHGIWLMLLAGIICVGFAGMDEYHQSFVSGRSPSLRDVGIDSFGVFWGIVLVRIVGWTGRKTIFRPRKKKKPAPQPVPAQYYPPQPDFAAFDPYSEPKMVPRPKKKKKHFFSKNKDAEDTQPIIYDKHYYMNQPNNYQQSPYMHDQYYQGPRPDVHNPQDPFEDWLDDYFPEEDDK